jgi:hypothetical protein
MSDTVTITEPRTSVVEASSSTATVRTEVEAVTVEVATQSVGLGFRITVGETAPASPRVGDVWIDTSN